MFIVSIVWTSFLKTCLVTFFMQKKIHIWKAMCIYIHNFLNLKYQIYTNLHFYKTNGRCRVLVLVLVLAHHAFIYLRLYTSQWFFTDMNKWCVHIKNKVCQFLHLYTCSQLILYSKHHYDGKLHPSIWLSLARTSTNCVLSTDSIFKASLWP